MIASGQKRYRAAGEFNIPIGTGVWFEITGSASKQIRVQSVRVSNPLTAAVAEEPLTVQVGKFSTTTTGGTASAVTAVPLDSTAPAATATVRRFSAAPTIGTLVGAIGAQRIVAVKTAASTSAKQEAFFDFSNWAQPEDGVALNGAAQAVALQMTTGGTAAVTLSIEVEWTEA